MAKLAQKEAPAADDLAELSLRLVYSLLKPAVAIATRFGVSMNRFIELTRMAYFEEHRQRAPADLAGVAKRLGQSLRTVGSLNRRFRGEFFRPEQFIAPLRRITGLLLAGPQSLDDLLSSANELRPIQITSALELLVANGWVQKKGDQFELSSNTRNLVSDDFGSRIDGLNHQLETLTESVWNRFVVHNDATARAPDLDLCRLQGGYHPINRGNRTLPPPQSN